MLPKAGTQFGCNDASEVSPQISFVLSRVRDALDAMNRAELKAAALTFWSELPEKLRLDFLEIITDGFHRFGISDRNAATDVEVTEHAFIYVAKRQKTQRGTVGCKRKTRHTGLYIAYQVVMTQHYALGPACCAGSVNQGQ